MKKFLNFTFYLFILSVISSFSLMAKQPPKIGGKATISVQASDSGIINLGGAGEGISSAKQAVGAVLQGNITGGLDITVNANKGAIVNVGVSAEGKAFACQAVGTIGDNCDENSVTLE